MIKPLLTNITKKFARLRLERGETHGWKFFMLLNGVPENVWTFPENAKMILRYTGVNILQEKNNNTNAQYNPL